MACSDIDRVGAFPDYTVDVFGIFFLYATYFTGPSGVNDCKIFQKYLTDFV